MRSKPSILRLILGDQLNLKHSWFKLPNDDVVYVLMEVRQETDYTLHHIQKVAAFFAAMRSFADRLKELGHRVIYLHLDAPDNRQALAENIQYLIEQHAFSQFEYILPDEFRLDAQLRALAQTLPIKCHPVDSEHFSTERQDLADFFQGKKRYLMESFYRWMRKRHDILMDHGKPVGGKWNFDQKNRQTYDHKVPIPAPILFENDVSEIVDCIQKKGVKTLGEIQAHRLIWPVTRDQALELLDRFVTDVLPAFGTYQDAMLSTNWYLFHSRLSFALNSKMLDPLEVIQAAVKAWQAQNPPVAIQQIEGFVRQVLGWREYMRGIYWTLMPKLESSNYFSHTGDLPSFYWTGTTDMTCMQKTITQSLQYAYAHHIQRLMVTGNFALLAGIDPQAVDDWYLGIYIDAIQWVELPNTRAMSQFADGGQVATKPYVSSARYINAMSDYCKSCNYDWKKRYGTGSCPFNSLYWDFFNRHRELLQKNARIGMMYRTWDRMDSNQRKDILRQAHAYRNNLNTL